MFPVLAIILFFALGLAFFVLSSKNDFGIDKIKNSSKSNDQDLLNQEIKKEKQVEKLSEEEFESEVKEEIKKENQDGDLNKEDLDEEVEVNK
tara:strand:- start:338 stop:613 length:276 start_codon:yes stop_codon:yes gene_type:complete